MVAFVIKAGIEAHHALLSLLKLVNHFSYLMFINIKHEHTVT